MSGIFGVTARKNNYGIQQDDYFVLQRSATRGRDGWSLATIFDGGHIEIESKAFSAQSARIPTLVDSDARYARVGCAYAASEPVDPPFVHTSADKSWTVAIDGEVVGYTGQGVANLLQSKGADAFHELNGNFAIIGVYAPRPGLLWYATKSKPLYALYSTTDEVARIASSKDAFLGMYHLIRSPSPFLLGPNEYGTINVNGQLSQYPLPTGEGSGSLVLCGGGLDSLVAAHYTKFNYAGNIVLLYVDYGCKAAEQEWTATQAIARSLGTGAVTMKIPFGFFQLVDSPLVPGAERNVEKSPIKGVAHEWVPARNTVLAALGISLAESNGLARVVTGINMTAASAYPDNEWQWALQLQEFADFAVGVGRRLQIYSPLAGMTKAEIVKHGKMAFNIDYEETMSWSCYEGGDKHCGNCSSCRARQTAFDMAGVKDPTAYRSNR